MSDVFQLLGTLRNKLRCTLRHLRQQLRHSLRASEIRLRRAVRTDFLLRVPPRWNNSNWSVDHVTAADHMEPVCDGYDNGGSVYAYLVPVSAFAPKADKRHPSLYVRLVQSRLNAPQQKHRFSTQSDADQLHPN